MSLELAGSDSQTGLNILHHLRPNPEDLRGSRIHQNDTISTSSHYLAFEKYDQHKTPHLDDHR